MVWAPLLPLALLPLFWDQAPTGSPCPFLPNLGPSQGLAWPPFLTGHQNEGAPEPQAGGSRALHFVGWGLRVAMGVTTLDTNLNEGSRLWWQGLCQELLWPGKFI